MNLSMNQKQTHRRRDQTGGCKGVRGWGKGMEWEAEVLTQGINLYRMDKQQGPTAQHRELYSIPCDKQEWKRII